MKTIKKFSEFHQSVNDCSSEILEATDDVDSIFENRFQLPKENHKLEADPPAVLIMQRKAIRNYGNQRIALYYIKQLNKYVTIPYDHLKWSMQGEEVEQVEESVMPHLQHIVDNHTAKSIKFKDGKSMKVDAQTANAILKVHGALNDENKKKVSDMAHKSKEHFTKVADFAWKHVTYKK